MNTDIQNQFLQLAKANEKVRLFNTYKGLPVSFEAEFVKISNGVVTFKVHKYQALCIKQAKYTLIKHDIFQTPIYANMLRIDFNEMTASLNEFKRSDNNAGGRQMIRVEPEKPFSVVVSSGIVVNADTIDVSKGGLGIYLKNTLFDPNKFDYGKLVSLEYRNPMEKRLIVKLNGVITHILPQPDYGRHRLGIQTFIDEQTLKSIQQFIEKRQVEILMELETIYRLLINSKYSNKVPSASTLLNIKGEL